MKKGKTEPRVQHTMISMEQNIATILKSRLPCCMKQKADAAFGIGKLDCKRGKDLSEADQGLRCQLCMTSTTLTAPSFQTGNQGLPTNFN